MGGGEREEDLGDVCGCEGFVTTVSRARESMLVLRTLASNRKGLQSQCFSCWRENLAGPFGNNSLGKAAGAVCTAMWSQAPGAGHSFRRPGAGAGACSICKEKTKTAYHALLFCFFLSLGFWQRGGEKLRRTFARAQPAQYGLQTLPGANARHFFRRAPAKKLTYLYIITQP